MQVLLLLEFLAECAFLLARCLASNNEDDPTCQMSFRQFTMARAVYAVPVIALNASILFIGGGPTGSCKFPPLSLSLFFMIVVVTAFFLSLLRDETKTADQQKCRTSLYAVQQHPPHL